MSGDLKSVDHPKPEHYVDVEPGKSQVELKETLQMIWKSASETDQQSCKEN